jgi:hypothetical protein
MLCTLLINHSLNTGIGADQIIRVDKITDINTN